MMTATATISAMFDVPWMVLLVYVTLNIILVSRVSALPDVDADSSFNPYKRAKLHVDLLRRPIRLQDYALSRQPAWDKPFLFGKRSADMFDEKSVLPDSNPYQTQKRPMFKFGKREDDAEKRAHFRLGESAAQNQRDRPTFLFGKRLFIHDNAPQINEEGEKRRVFKFGKRLSFDEDDADIELHPLIEYPEKRRKFQFGKRLTLDDNGNKRPIFKFGKRWPEYIDEEKRRIFKFGKRTLADDSSEGTDDEGIEKRRRFKFGKRSVDQLERTPFMFGKRSSSEIQENDKKRKIFKFGKRYFVGDDINQVTDDENMRHDVVKRRRLQFGKRVSHDYEDAVDKRRKFTFGKRTAVDESQEDTDEKRAVFKFGKRSSAEIASDDVDKRRKFMFGKRQLATDSKLEYDKRRIFKFGKRMQDGDSLGDLTTDDKRAKFKFGKKSVVDDDDEFVDDDVEKRARFKFGKRNSHLTEVKEDKEAEGSDLPFSEKSTQEVNNETMTSDDRETYNDNYDKRALFKFGKREPGDSSMGGNYDEQMMAQNPDFFGDQLSKRQLVRQISYSSPGRGIMENIVHSNKNMEHNVKTEKRTPEIMD